MSPDRPSTTDVLARKIREEIARDGPIPFSRFMDLALYEPSLGYYRQGRDPFGRTGDYFTAEQLQPVFGRLISAAVSRLYEDLGRPADFTVVELGAGRAEMAPVFQPFRYIPVDIGDTLPERFAGVVFSNEFFDALPVDLAARAPHGWIERNVHWTGSGFAFSEGPPVESAAQDYLSQFAAPEQQLVEIHSRIRPWMEAIAGRLTNGFVLTVDYGYTQREAIRFPQGSLMSYRRHQASENVLGEPGSRDITSHVPFAVLEREGERAGLRKICLESLAQFLMGLGEENFTKAVAGGHELQLKTLLFGMGESFRVLLQRK